MRTLNITNGDGAANIIKHSAVTGDVLPWRDPMHHGPFPADLDLRELSALRARYLAGPDADPREAERDFALRDQHLDASASYDSITLWFEHDLLDQLQILQILDWFSGADRGEAALGMICIDSFPGMPAFRGIGQLDADQMASLADLRRPVPSAVLDLAAAGWAAFRSEDPNDLLAYLGGDLGGLPFLDAALRRHLEEYPDKSTGLTRTERQLLGLIGAGVQNPGQLFVENMELETALFIGDWSTYGVIGTLCDAGLVACAPSPFRFPSFADAGPQEFGDQRLSLTDVGRDVLSGQREAFGLLARDGWLGGVKLMDGGAVWTWDKDAARFLRREI